MAERDIERKSREMALRHGGRLFKWTGTTGAPDRILLLPVPPEVRPLLVGFMAFVEFKTPSGVISRVQAMRQEELRGLGYPVRVARSPQEAFPEGVW